MVSFKNDSETVSCDNFGAHIVSTIGPETPWLSDDQRGALKRIIDGVANPGDQDTAIEIASIAFERYQMYQNIQKVLCLSDSDLDRLSLDDLVIRLSEVSVKNVIFTSMSKEWQRKAVRCLMRGCPYLIGKAWYSNWLKENK